MKKEKNIFQSTVRVYDIKYPRLYHHLTQLDSSQGELILMLAEQAIKMGNLENIHPREILNGTCYTKAINTSHVPFESHRIETKDSMTSPSLSHSGNIDDGLGTSAVKFGVIK